MHSLLGLMKAHSCAPSVRGEKQQRRSREEPQEQVLPEGQQLPSQQHGRGLRGSDHPSGFSSPRSFSCFLELFHATVFKHLWVWFSTALPYPKFPNSDQRTQQSQTPPFKGLAAWFLSLSSTKHKSLRSSSSSPWIAMLLDFGADTVLFSSQLSQLDEEQENKLY